MKEVTPMEKALKVWYTLLQGMFFVFVALSFLATVFWYFGDREFQTVFRNVIIAIGFLAGYFVFYRLYVFIYRKEDVKTMPEHMDQIARADQDSTQKKL